MANPLLSSCSAVTATVWCAMGGTATAAAVDTQRKSYDIGGGDAAGTLKRFADESGKQIVYLVDVVRGVTTNPVKGEFTGREALHRMVANTSLVVVEDEKTGALMINRVASAEPAPAPAEPSSEPRPQRLAEEPPKTTKNMKHNNLVGMLIGWLALAAVPTNAAQAAEGVGALTGTVSNTATGNLLEGAKIEVPSLGLKAFTDNTGRFVLPAVPAGTHELVASYTGLDPVRATVTVVPSQRATRNFDLTTEIYQMQALTVTGEREGGALAITAERNADNVKNVVAMDSFGNLPNLNAGEVAMRLPGVVGQIDAGGASTGFTVRGMGPGLNTVTIDGGLITSDGGLVRSSVINNLTGTMFEQVELTKGHTPDKGADSLGGTINFKSRSPLSMKEKRRVTYSLCGVLAPSFTQQVPLREQHPFHQIINVGYMEVFDAFGGERNLGVAVNLFNSESARGWFNTTRDYENTTKQPAYLWDYRTKDSFNKRLQNSINVKTDYRLSLTTKLTFVAIAMNQFEFFNRNFETRAFTTQSIGTTGTAGILPGYTDRVTQVRAAPGSTIDETSNGPGGQYNRMRRFDLGAEHEFGWLQLDYNARHAETHIANSPATGGALINRITNVGWILDRTQSDLYPRFIQTAGPDFTNPANYRPAPNGLSNAAINKVHKVGEAVANARYTLPVSIPAYVKGGLFWRDQQVKDHDGSRRWNYTGTTALPADPSILMFDQVKTGRSIPQWDSAAFINGRNPDPALWREDVYYHEQLAFTNTRAVTETITAGYVMAQGRVGQTGLLAGVRTEKTETEGRGWVRSRTSSTAAQQQADPVGSAQHDYANNFRELQGSYTKSFPSVHLTQDITRNLRARLSWSTSFGRPAINNALPNETVSEANQTLTINNAGLLPQSAANWDATLDYYFEPVGNFSVGWFHKTIKDYIVDNVILGTVPTGADNGYNGEYAGFSLRQSSNAGTAIVQGWEFSYQQQFTFLPGFLKGLGALANFTVIDTHGDFGGTADLTTGQVAGFIPRAGNLGVSWRYHGFSTRVLANYTSGYIQNYSAASAGRNLYRFPRTVLSVGFAYQVRPALVFSCDIDNPTNEEQALYRGIPDQVQSRSIPGTTISFGVSGRF